MNLDELLNTPIEWKLVMSGSEEWMARFPTGKDRTIMFIAHRKTDADAWDISFAENKETHTWRGSDVETSYKKTGQGNELAVFATLKSIIAAFLKEKNPEKIVFEADKEQSGSRANLYQRLFAKNLPGYTIARDDSRDWYSKFTLTRKDLNEVLDKPLKYSVESSKWGWDASFVAGDRNIDFVAAQIDDDTDEWDIEFMERKTTDHSSKSDLTGSGNEFAVFATIKAIIAELIKEKKPNSITFASETKTTRARLYKKMLMKNIPAGYRVVSAGMGEEVWFTLIRQRPV